MLMSEYGAAMNAQQRTVKSDAALSNLFNLNMPVLRSVMLAVLIMASLVAPSEPILVTDRDFVLGELSAGHWQRPKNLHLSFPVDTQRFGIGKPIGEGKIAGFSEDAETDEVYDLADGSTKDAQLVGRQPTFPRPVTIPAGPRTKYVRMVNSFLAGKMHFKPEGTRITQLFRVDLDGDGRDEMLITASNTTEERVFTSMADSPLHRTGDYSALLLQYLDKRDRPHLVALDVDYKKTYRDALNLCQVDAIADIDGDNKMEIISSSRYYEGTAVVLWNFKNGKLKELVSAASGA
jgi:hypothetical protein